jgi:large subunit ribosomal protein L6
MSRMGKIPVVIPSGVTVKLQGNALTVKGPKGELTRTFHPDLSITVADSKIVIARPENPLYAALHGLTRALIHNMILGVTQGYKRDLEIEGVGYRAELQGKNLSLSLGFSHPVNFPAPAGITFEVDKSQRVIAVTGADKELVGQVAARLRGLRPPEPYKGKGIHYLGERIRHKAGKAGKVGTAGTAK